jgi:hypothetical protein
MINILRLILQMLAVILLANDISAEAKAAGNVIASEAPNWCDSAINSLDQLSSIPFKCSLQTSRCIKMNNYSCTKNFSNVPYPGQMTSANNRPMTDVDHHVLYVDPKWSLLKTIDVLRRFYNEGLHSAMAIAERWAPWCDTNGSKLLHEGWGRTCTDGPGRAPVSFHGPRCTKPANGRPLRGQCGPCNCPNEIAAFYLKGSGKGLDDDLTLFDAEGTPTSTLASVLRQVVAMELGYRPKPSLIEAAISAYRP